MRQAFIRAVRTFVQTFTGVWLASNVIASARTLNDIANISAAETALVAAIVAVVTLLHNVVEDLAPKVDTREGIK